MGLVGSTVFDFAQPTGLPLLLTCLNRGFLRFLYDG
jgi:hypothetical protein